MAPVVHGLERQYQGRVDFLYLNVADSANAEARRRLGFRSTPHFFFLRADGTPTASFQGVVAPDSLDRMLGRLARSTASR